MQCADFQAVLQPNASGGSQSQPQNEPQWQPQCQPPPGPAAAARSPSPQVSPEGERPAVTYGTTTPPRPPRLPLRRSDSTGPECSPTWRLSGSPNVSYPTYQAGAVQSFGAVLPPPPPIGAASPLAGASPMGGFASFAVYGADPMSPQRGLSFGGADPSSPGPGVSASPMARGGLTPNRFGTGPLASPSRRRPTIPDKRPPATASRIDPEQVPRPIGQPEAVKEEGGKVYETSKYHVPPASTSVCTIVDRGVCSCEFMRATVNQVPAYPSTANAAHVPIAVVCQPFAELTPQEEPVPLVDFGESGPMRCTRCKAYINPHFSWASQGREATCNFCGQRIEVPPDYVCILDEKGRRRDASERPELQRGTVDYVAPRDYSDTLPSLPAVVFVIEASQRSVKSGLLPQVLWTLRSLIGFLEPPASRIAIMTFDHALHFYSFYPGLDSARVVTVSDIEEPFVPCSPDVLCVDVRDEAYRSQVEALLEQLPGLLADTRADQVAGGAALKAAVELMGSRGGGHVVMFHASLPNTGCGALRVRDDLRLAKDPDAGGLFAPQQAPFFDAVFATCLAKGVAVSTFTAPPLGVYLDLASLSSLPRRTGGEIVHIPGFDPARDGERLHYDLSRTVVQASVYSCVFKLRCSRGLTVESTYATWDPEFIDQSTFQVARLSVDATANFLITHSERIEGQKHVYFQAACLYTDRQGRRLIRVHTLQLAVTSSLSNVFRYTEIDTVTNLLLKQAAAAALTGGNGFKDKLSKACVDMLHAYRVNCASMTSAGQLILPESLKLLPLYIGSIRKMAAFRSGSEIRIDDRIAGLLRALSLPMALTSPLIYPRIYTLVPLGDKAGFPTGVAENVYLPPTIAACIDKLATDRVYLVDNGVKLRIYVRDEVPAEVLQRVFGVDSIVDVPAALARPEEELSEEAVRILAIVQQIRRERWRLPWQPLSVVLPGTPEEPRLLSVLCEDRVGNESNYVDFLCNIHKMVQNKQE